MKCQEFNERLYDYLDEALPGDVQARAREHLSECRDCRRALQREQAVAHSIQQSLGHATARLFISPEGRRRILGAWKSGPVPTHAWSLAWRWFNSKSFRFGGAGAALLGALLLLFLGFRTHRETAASSGSSATVEARQPTWVIDVPIQTQTHVSRQEGVVVIDAIASSVAVGHARLFGP